MKRANVFWLFIALMFLQSAEGAAQNSPNVLPRGFVYADELIPSLILEMRYCTDENFIGRPIDGYLRPRCILTAQAAQALATVQEKLKPFGLGLKIFDAYRPQRAVDHFVRWAQDAADITKKKEYYPDLAKDRLFPEGYIAERSSHSRGSTVDLTIVSIRPENYGSELDMGSGFDFFGPKSAPLFQDQPPDIRAHRMLLQRLMVEAGFVPYSEEWWHFTLKNEPFPDTFFNFPVQ